MLTVKSEERGGGTTGWTYPKEEFCVPLCWEGWPRVGWWYDWSRGYCKQRASMSSSTPSHMWGSWYLPRFLFNGESWTLMYMASLMVLVMPCNSLPSMEKLSSLMTCPVVWEWSKMGEGLEMLLVPSPKFLTVSPMYSMVHCGWSRLYLYITPSFLQMLSLFMGATNNSLTVLAPLIGTCTPTFPHMF